MNLKQTTKRKTDKNHQDAMKEGYLRLGDVCEVQNGFAFDSKFFSTNKESGIPLIRIRDILKGHSCTYYTSSYQEEYIVHKGDFLIGMDGDFNIGQWQSEDALLNQRVCRLLPSDKILPKFIFYFIPTVLQRINAETSYATVKHLSSKQIKEILIPNISLTEQQRIVALLDAEFAKIDALKANAEKNLQNAKDLFQAALKKELEPKRGWKLVRINEVYNFIDYRGATPTKLSEGIPLVTAKNVKMGFLDYSIKDFISTEEYANRQSRGVSHKGDILITTEAPLGNVAIADKEVFSAGQRVITLQQYSTPNYKALNVFYLYYLLSPTFQEELKQQATGLTALGIKASRLKEMKVPVLSISEQQAIATRLDALNEKCKTLQANYEKTLSLCDDLKQALLRSVFGDDPVAIGTDAPVRPYGK